MAPVRTGLSRRKLLSALGVLGAVAVSAALPALPSAPAPRLAFHPKAFAAAMDLPAGVSMRLVNRLDIVYGFARDRGAACRVVSA